MANPYQQYFQPTLGRGAAQLQRLQALETLGDAVPGFTEQQADLGLAGAATSTTGAALGTTALAASLLGIPGLGWLAAPALLLGAGGGFIPRVFGGGGDQGKAEDAFADLAEAKQTIAATDPQGVGVSSASAPPVSVLPAPSSSDMLAQLGEREVQGKIAKSQEEAAKTQEIAGPISTAGQVLGLINAVGNLGGLAATPEAVPATTSWEMPMAAPTPATAPWDITPGGINLDELAASPMAAATVAEPSVWDLPGLGGVLGGTAAASGGIPSSHPVIGTPLFEEADAVAAQDAFGLGRRNAERPNIYDRYFGR